MLSLLTSIACFWNRNNFDSEFSPVQQVLQEPSQRPIELQPFTAKVNEKVYEIYPQYDYAISGLVVSYRHHDGDAMLHRAWNDHLNMADVCVVWGKNTTDIDLNDFEFRNAQFTCFIQAHDPVNWQSFDMTQISNNHLISDNPLVREKIQDLRIGDQIHIQGWLASYGQDGRINRGTSTVRTDMGNGACETIYVKHFQVLQEGSSAWRMGMYLSLFLSFILAIVYFRQKPILHNKLESYTHEQIDADRI